MHEIADGVYRLGSRLVSWYLVESGGRFTVIDAGNPSQFEQLPKAMASLGKTLHHIDAVLLTHAHGNHLGSSVRIKHESEADVHVHVADEDLALGRANRTNERHYLRDAWRPFAVRSFLSFLIGGATKAVPHVTVSTFGDGERIDVPGTPRTIHTPGHTAGSACLWFEDRSVLCTGDALATLNVVTGEVGPTLMPRSFNEDSAMALESLAAVSAIREGIVLPGHGEPWADGPAAAVAVVSPAV